MQGAQRLPQPAKPTDPMLGRVVAGRYRLEARIGEGGMGVVYRARHVLIDRVVALKLIRPDLRGETHLRAWMLREARAANRVDHAHIIDIHDIGETEEGELYLVMEYLVGTSLSSELARGPMPLARGVDILEQMCAALARAHDLGVVHRDLKSDNILLTHARRPEGLRQDPRLRPRRTSRWTRASRPKGAVFGTPEYMSPEQARGEEATPQSDLYALGVLFFEMLTGQLPFRIERSRDAARDAAHAPSRRARARSSRTCCPRPRRSSLKLLEKDRRKRFQDAHHLHEELKALQRSLPSTPWEVAATGEQRRAAASAAAAVAGRHRVGEPRRALLAHGVARVPGGQRAARGAERARAGVGSRGARERGSRARWRATRASSRRSSAAVARCAPRSAARSRSWRTRSRARCARPPPSRRGVDDGCARARAAAEKVAAQAKQRGRRRPRGAGAAAARRSSSARARPRRLRRGQARAARASTSRRPRAKDAQARDLRRQIEELRAPARALRRGARGGSGAAAARRSRRARARASPSRRRSARSRRCSSTT